MPNWTTNKIIGKESVLSKYITTTDEGWRFFDFEKIEPTPEDLEFDYQPVDKSLVALALEKPEMWDELNTAYKLLMSDDCATLDKTPGFPKDASHLYRMKLDVEFPRNVMSGAKIMDNVRKYGYIDKRAWRCQHWGVVWNVGERVCDIQNININGNELLEIAFDTSWNIPEGIYKKIFAENPNEKFVICWQTENDMSCFVCVDNSLENVIEINNDTWDMEEVEDEIIEICDEVFE